jgi:hypothetical protein
MNNPWLFFCACCIAPWLASCAFMFYAGRLSAQGGRLHLQSPLAFRRYAKAEPRPPILGQVKDQQRGNHA